MVAASLGTHRRRKTTIVFSMPFNGITSRRGSLQMSNSLSILNIAYKEAYCHKGCEHSLKERSKAILHCFTEFAATAKYTRP